MTEQATTTAVGRRIPPADTKSVTRLADSSSAHVPHPDDAVTRATDTSTARLGKETTRRYRGNTVPTGQLMVTRGAACDVAHFCKVRALIPPSLQHTHTAAHVLANAPPAPRVTSTTTRTPSLAPASEPAATAARQRETRRGKTSSIAPPHSPVSFENTPLATASVPRISGMPRFTTCSSMSAKASSLGMLGYRFCAAPRDTDAARQRRRVSHVPTPSR